VERNVNSAQYTKLTSPVHFLTAQQKMFVEQIIKGKPPNIAARMAGYSKPDAQCYQIVKSPKVAAAIQYLHKKHEKVVDMSRKKVMDGFLEAIDMARMQADSGNMVAGWREIAKMCGYYAPEVRRIDVNITAKRVIDKLETLSDEDLLKMVEDSAQIIEGEASVLLEDLQKASDDEFSAQAG
jgi:Terminase small subunit